MPSNEPYSIEYGSFEGTIPEGKYGAGAVRIWDNGKYEAESDPLIQFKKGKIVVIFFGLKLRGEFTLVRMADQEENWLFIKHKDLFADEDWVIEPVLEPRKKETKKRRTPKR